MSGRLVRRASVAAAGILAIATNLQAQGGARPKQPVAKPVPVYAFPKVHTETLPNGLVVQIVENHALPLVAVRVVIEGGMFLDPVGKEGLFVLDTALLSDGTTSKNGERLSQAMDQLGATVTPLSFTGVASELAQALPLMGEMLEHPIFPNDGVDQQKAALTTVVERSETRADAVATRLLNQILFGPDHRIGRPTTAASIASITRDDLVRFHDANIRPQNATLVIVGDVTPTSVMPLVTSVFGDWQKTGERAAVNVPAGLPAAPTSIYLFDRPGSPQTTVRIGQLGPSRSSPDYYALDLATSVLGGASGSRLAKSLREQHALTYGVTHITQWRGWDDPSTIVGVAQVDAAKTDSALLVWMGELNDIRRSRPITDQELQFGRGITVGNMATRFETYDSIANQVAALARDHLPMTFVDDYVQHINATPASEATQIIARYLDPTHTVIVVVGDRKTIEAPLRAANLGPVVIVDASGKTVQ